MYALAKKSVTGHVHKGSKPREIGRAWWRPLSITSQLHKQLLDHCVTHYYFIPPIILKDCEIGCEL